jgi:ornithine carbamoyltransferase
VNSTSFTLSGLLANNPLRGRSLLSIADLSGEEAEAVLFCAEKLKARRKSHLHTDEFRTSLAHKSVALIFQKPSLRTRTTFDLGVAELGAHPVYLGPEMGFGVRESASDIGCNLSRWVHAIVARVYAQSDLEELAQTSRLPVINALSDFEHPCQALADFLTLRERWGSLRGRRLAYIGDGNNVLHSLMYLAALQGLDLVAACPEGYDPEPAVLKRATEVAASHGSSLKLVRDVQEAAAGADALYTDTWISMGQEEETERRRQAFRGYQINQELLRAARADAVVMHCLPAHRGEEVTAEVLDGPQSVIYDQAENRLHAQKAVLLLTMHSGPGA